MIRYYKLIECDDMGETYKFLHSIGIPDLDIYTCPSYGGATKQKFFAIQRESYTTTMIKELLLKGFKKD